MPRLRPLEANGGQRGILCNGLDSEIFQYYKSEIGWFVCCREELSLGLAGERGIFTSLCERRLLVGFEVSIHLEIDGGHVCLCDQFQE